MAPAGAAPSEPLQYRRYSTVTQVDPSRLYRLILLGSALGIKTKECSLQYLSHRARSPIVELKD